MRSFRLCFKLVRILSQRPHKFAYCRGSTSHPTHVLCGVPRGSVLGLILFLLYTADLLRLVELNNLCPHLYTDDTQIYGVCHPTDAAQLQ